MRNLLFFLVIISLTNSALASDVLFSCVAKTGEKILLSNESGRFVLHVNTSIYKSRNTSSEIINSFKPISEFDAEYLEFMVTQRYVLIGNFNSSENSDSSPNNMVEIDTLGSNTKTIYNCSVDVINNISEILLLN